MNMGQGILKYLGGQSLAVSRMNGHTANISGWKHIHPLLSTLLRREQGLGLSDSFAIGCTVQMIPMGDKGRRFEDWNNRVGLIRYLDWLSRKST